MSERVSDEELQHGVVWQGSMDKTVLLHDAPFIRRLCRDLLDARAENERLRVVVEAAERVRETSMYGDIGDISASRRADQAECELAAALDALSTGKETEDG